MTAPTTGQFILLRQHVAEVLRISPERLADISLEIETYRKGPEFQYLDFFDRQTGGVLRLCLAHAVERDADETGDAGESNSAIVVNMRNRDDFTHILFGLLHEAESEYRQRGAPVILIWNEAPGLDFWYVKRTANGDVGLFHSCCSFDTAWTDIVYSPKDFH
jgi:hypothetical protein